MASDHANEQGSVSGVYPSWLANMHHVRPLVSLHLTKHLADLADPLLCSLSTLKSVSSFKVAYAASQTVTLMLCAATDHLPWQQAAMLRKIIPGM